MKLDFDNSLILKRNNFTIIDLLKNKISILKQMKLLSKCFFILKFDFLVLNIIIKNNSANI